jgi:biopolymer transport protein ExbD
MKLRAHRRNKATLDMTPLIDVVFLLLIFFMVSTTFDKETRLKVDLPEASAQAPSDETPAHISLTIDAGGHFYVNDAEVINTDVDTLRRALEKAAGNKRDLPVILTVDRNAAFQSTMTAMDAAAQAGLSRLRFVADQKKALGRRPCLVWIVTGTTGTPWSCCCCRWPVCSV